MGNRNRHTVGGDSMCVGGREVVVGRSVVAYDEGWVGTIDTALDKVMKCVSCDPNGGR